MPLTGIALVTGGAGFIGSHIAAALIADGARVRVLDDLSTGHRENIEEIGGDLDFVEGSVADEQLLEKVLEDVELVFHRSRHSVCAAFGRGAAPNTYCIGRRHVFVVGCRARQEGAATGLRCFKFSLWRSTDSAQD